MESIINLSISLVFLIILFKITMKSTLPSQKEINKSNNIIVDFFIYLKILQRKVLNMSILKLFDIKIFILRIDKIITMSTYSYSKVI